MKIVIALDSFKGSLTSLEAGNAVKKGIERVYKDAEIFVRPIADGGEGTVDAVISAMNGELRTVIVSDPLGRPIESSYGIADGTAFIEMAAASGITLVSANERDPLNTTTYGVGELLKDAMDQGIRNFVIGIGGSATNDGGIGMLSALGLEFLDENGKNVPFGAKGLGSLAEIRTDNALKELKECTFKVACDVKNPLCGENGCSAVFGPQKGATSEMIEKMDKWLCNYAELTKAILPSSDPDLPGSGAAGGLGFALRSYLGSELTPGIDLIMKATGLEAHIKDADIVITGEGSLDRQSYMGKAPVGVAKLAKKYGKPVIAFAGAVTPGASICNEHGIDAFFPAVRTPCSLEEAMAPMNATANLSDTAEQVFRVINMIK